MRSRLTRLSGPRAGEWVWLDRMPVLVGAGENQDVVVPGAALAHAVLLQRKGRWILQDGAPVEGTYLAGVPVREAALQNGDVIELGRGGPRLRFEEASRFELPGVAGAGVRGAAARWRRLRRRLAAETRRPFRWMMAAAVAAFGAYLLLSHLEARREVTHLRESMEQAASEFRSFEERIHEERERNEIERQTFARKIQEFRDREAALGARLGVSAGDVGAVRADLEQTRERIVTLESERAAGERIIREYGAGVCLIQGSYAFYDTESRPLRHLIDSDGETLRDEDGPKLGPDGAGAIYTVDYYGTGFLADRRGIVLTNRHVALPWRDDPRTEDLQTRGFSPRFVLFRAFFPGQAEPFELEEVSHSELVDLAALRIALRGRRLPVLPLDRTGRGAVAGQPIVVVGYPTGLEAILAKADTGVVQSILKRHGRNSERVTELLSEQGLIRPSTTQGHIGDITSTDIVFDAPTTQGGSGGPIFNKAGKVVAIEYAVLPKFGGTAYGLPIESAVELLRTLPKDAASRK